MLFYTFLYIMYIYFLYIQETNGRQEEYMKYKKDYLDENSKYENYR